MEIKITDKLGAAINKGMIGLFFEDINYGLDGGLHGEMIENRSFEFVEVRGVRDNYDITYDGLYGWTAYPKSETGARLNIQTTKPQNAVNQHYLEFTGVGGQMGFANKAYDGIFMKKDLSYHVSFYARTEGYQGGIEVSIIKDDKVAASAVAAEKVTGEWTKYQTDLICNEDVSYGTFVIKLNQPGTVCFDFISMLPSDAVLGLFRRDLVELLQDMKPGFVRFPGGCVIEGNTLENRYQWKNSVGKAEERKANWNRWAVFGNNEGNNFTSKFSHYNQTLGIGYYEYFLLCEYLGAKPLPVLSVGLACQFESSQLVEIENPAFQEFVQDAINLIEFANGPVDSKWGSLRAEMGHPEAFDLDLLGIGNEQWETERANFFKRYEIFEKAIHDKYPSIRLIGSAGPDVSSDKYTNAWNYYRANADNSDFVYAVDEHYYVRPQWLYDNVHFYDKYPRNIKVFAGEYAAHHPWGRNYTENNDWAAALSEAAFLTGLERNADVVVLASYAPLFARLGYTQWSPDLIWFDAEGSYGSPSYYVQKMYSTLIGTNLIKVENDNEEIPFTVSYDKDEQTIFVKLVNNLDHTVTVKLESKFNLEEDGEVFILQGSEGDVNSIHEPLKVAPVKHSLKVCSSMDYQIPSKSFHVIKMNCCK